jgi:hypothetical protein
MNAIADNRMQEIMLDTWRGHPERHLVAVQPDAGQPKKLRLIHSPLSAQAVQTHLNVPTDVLGGVGSVGVMPGIKSGKVWRTPWAVMDFDQQQPADLKPFFDLLLDRELRFVFSTGTTGRGAHLWFLLDQAITLHQANRALKFLKEVAVSIGWSGIDLRPDEKGEGSAGIMLPYRGAARDGEGVNPLYDPATGALILLSELPSFPRQDAKMFARLGSLRSVERFFAGLAPEKQPVHAPRLASEIPTAAEAWEAELGRLCPLWKPGRRNSLTVAASAFGLSLGINPEQLRDELMELIKSSHDEEESDREQVIDLAIKRHINGELLAYKHFYTEAGVQTPIEARSAAVRSLVCGGMERLMDSVWHGKAGKTDRSVHKTLLNLAAEFGYKHTFGVEISVAWSALIVEANVGSYSTLSKCLARLQAADLLRRGAVSVGGKSSSFILLLPNRSIPLRGGAGNKVRSQEESYCLSSALRNGVNRPGKPREEVIDLLGWHGAMSIKEMATRLEIRPTDLRKRLAALKNRDLILWDEHDPDSMIRLIADIKKRLEEIQESDGSEAAKKKQELDNLRKTQLFRAFLKQSG